MLLTAALGCHIKINMTIQMQLRHWNQDVGDDSQQKSCMIRMPKVLG